MPVRFLRQYPVALAILLGSASLAAGGGGPKPSQTLTPENRSEVNRLLVEYRAAGGDLEKKEDICRKVLAIGPGAVPLMLSAVERELQPLVKRYCSKFQAQAVSAAKRKVGRVDLNKVVQLRNSVLELQKLGEGFTKEIIVQQIDPAMEKLRSVFILDRSEVLDKSPELQADRKNLEGLGRLWELCRAQQPPPDAKEGPGKSAPPSFEETLQGEEELAAAQATPQDPRTRAILVMNARLAEQLDPEEARAISALNLARNLLGLPPLAIDLKLCEAARDHSKDMDQLKFFSHESPVPGKKSFTDRAKLHGTTAGAENIHAGGTSGKSAHQGWFHSPGHHRNQMGRSNRVGVGRSGVYFTQMFGG